MKRQFYLIFVLLLIGCTDPRTDFTVDLRSNEGYGTFLPGNVILWPNNDSIYYRNVPNDINEFVVRCLPIQKGQYYWNRYLNNQLDKETFVNIIDYYKVDTTKLANEYVDCEVLFLIGTKIDKRVIIVDSDNDEDFGNEKVLEYDYPISIEKQQEKTPNLPVVLTQYDYFENNTVNTKTVKIMPSPYKGSMGVSFNTDNEVEKKYFLFAGFPEYKQGAISLNKTNCDVFVSNYFSSNTYENNRTKLFIFPKSDIIPSELNGDIPYRIGDIFNIKGHDYLIDSISRWGDSLFIKYVGENVYPRGITEGFYMPKFSAKYLDNSVFTIEQYEGKYLLFDFWGTWCIPCIKLIPELQKLNSDYKDKDFVLVSVAFDSDPKQVINFINENQMDWKHLFVNQNQSDKNSIIEKLKISSFPSTILLDPSGEIIARNKELLELRKILDEKLNAL